MTTLVYDHAPDVSGSSAIYAAYWNNEDKVLYLVFNNGTVSSRYLPSGYQSHHFDAVASWGSWWNNYLKGLPEAERVENGATFVHREQAPVETPKSDDDGAFGSLGQHVTSVPTFEVSDELVGVFVDAYDKYEDAHFWDGSHEEAVRAGLNAVASHVSAEAEAEPEPEAVEDNDDSTFVGIGFFDVPDALRPTLDNAVRFFDEFVQEQVGKVESHIESYTQKALREAFRRFVR